MVGYTAEGYPIITVADHSSGSDGITVIRSEPFAGYLMIEGDKGTVKPNTRLDREKYINGNLDKNNNVIFAENKVHDKDGKKIKSPDSEADYCGEYSLITDWNYTSGQYRQQVTNPNRYTYDHLGMLSLNLGMTMLTVEEKGGQSPES